MKAKFSVAFTCLLIACLLIAVIPTNVYAAEVASGSCGDNITWSLDDAGVLTVSGTGAMKDYEFAHETGTTAPWCAAGLPKLTEVIIGEGITHISKYGFAACSELKKVTIPDTVVTMGENAFGGCDSLVTVELPVNMTAIPYSAFNDCDNLVSVTGGEGIRAIGMLAFLNCPKLSEIDLSKVESISDDAFANCYALNPTGFSSQMHYLGGWTFQNTAIESLVVPDSVGVINRCSFYGCKQLKSVTFGMNVNWIYGLAFFDCDSLTSVTLPARVSELKEGAFAECSSLADIYVLNAECILPDDYYARLNGWDPSDTLVSTLGIPGITTIHGHAGSTAEAYATKNGYAFEALPETCEYGYHTLSTTMTKEATCLTDGWKTIACSLCEYKCEEVIHYPGHKIVNDVCENCNESFVAYSDQMNGGLWALNTDGTLYLYNAANGGDIPDAPWESYAEQITKIVIADRTYHLVIKNGVQSYVYYPNLTTIEINGGAAFYPSAYYAPNLTTFVVSEDFCSYGVIDGVLYGDFRSDGRYVVAYPAGLPGTVARFSGYVASNPLMKGNKIEKLYTAQNYLYPNSYSQNNDNLTDIYFTNKDMFVVEETDQIWSENSFANREKVTIHGYKGSRLEAIALQLGYRFVELTECEINGHKTGLVEKAATCVSTGVAAHYECSVCNQLSSDKLGDYPVQADSLIVAIVKTNHTGKTEVKNTIAVTCAKEGYTGDTYCADCAEKIANGSVIEKIAHTLTHNEAVAATCTEAGNVEHWQCNGCKVIFADKDAATVITTVTVPALGHDFGEGEAQDGVIVHKCLHCDATKSLKLPPAGMDVGMPAVSEKLQSSVMTESEKTRVQQGEKLDVYLEVSDISESVTEDDKEKVNEKLGNAKVGIYLDINLFKKVGNDRPAKVSEPGANVTISITVPLNLINTDALISREYQIIRIHNGVAEILKGVFDVNTNTFTFETDGFSTYVLTYQDTKLTTPATGDHADILLWTALITFSILSMTALVITKKRFF